MQRVRLLTAPPRRRARDGASRPRVAPSSPPDAQADDAAKFPLDARDWRLVSSYPRLALARDAWLEV